MSPRWHPWECKVCGARRPWVPISATGLCPDHAMQRVAENVAGLQAKRGQAYERWLRAIARGIVREARKLDAARDDG